MTNFHTHPLVALRPWFVRPEEASRRHFAELPVTLENPGAIQQDGLANKDNLFLGDIDAAVAEAAHFKKLGGNPVVETSPRGTGRDPLGLPQISNATRINIVCRCSGRPDVAQFESGRTCTSWSIHSHPVRRISAR